MMGVRAVIHATINNLTLATVWPIYTDVFTTWKSHVDCFCYLK